MKTINFILPDWTICPLFNSDESGISDDESKALAEFSEYLINKGIHAIPIDCEENGFSPASDLNQVAGNTYVVTFQIMDNWRVTYSQKGQTIVAKEGMTQEDAQMYASGLQDSGFINVNYEEV